MKAIELWFQLIVLFRLTCASAIFNDPITLHRHLMRSIRRGNLNEFENIVFHHPETIEKFNLAYWTMAMHCSSVHPESFNRNTIVDILLDGLRLKCNAQGDYTPLICAIHLGNVESIRKILRVASVNDPNASGETPLIVAICTANISIAKELIAHGADVNICDINGLNALHYATRLRNPSVRSKAIYLLLSNSADVSCFDYKKYHINYKNSNNKRIKKSFTDASIELNTDELLLRRLFMDMDKKAKGFAIIFILIFAAINIMST